MKKEKLTRNEILILSDSLLNQMSQINTLKANVNSSNILSAVNSELLKLRDLNTKLCKMLDEIA